MAQRSTQRTDILSAARCSDILPESYLRNLSNLPVHRNIAQIGHDVPNCVLAYSTKFRCTCQDKFHFFLENVQFIIMCERANKLRRTYFFTQKRRRGYEIRVLKARGAADYRGNVRKGRKAGRDCRARRQVPSDHIPRARARQDRGNGLPLSSRV